MGTLRNTFASVAAILKQVRENDLVLFVMRHGESLGQVDISAYRSLGDENLPLTNNGVRQAAAGGRILSALADQLGFSSMRVISSNGKRSASTARVVFRALEPEHKISVTFDERLDKQKFGKFDGLFSSAERREKCPEEFEIYQTQLRTEGLFHARPPQGESIGDIQVRARDFLGGLRGTPMPTILVTHGTNALCLENELLGHGQEWVLAGIDKRPNCSIRLLAGNATEGYRALNISDTPVADSRSAAPAWQKGVAYQYAM